MQLVPRLETSLIPSLKKVLVTFLIDFSALTQLLPCPGLRLHAVVLQSTKKKKPDQVTTPLTVPQVGFLSLLSR